MRKNLVISIGIFLSLAASRFIPHPPNFTSLIALSFYVPVFLGLRFLPALLISFAVTDFIIGYHSGTHWTWGSVLLIGVASMYFRSSFLSRISGALFGALIFFIITNFGVWTSGMYEYNLSGLISCYTLAIPFFGYTIISTFIFSSLIETIYSFDRVKFNISKINGN
tara:strand:+ start:455 stop:955 length:501 start_codon:yes stop_codon:yes gene_type:complete